MDERRRPVHRLLRLERGSLTIEGLAAIVTFFVLLLLIVQIGFLAGARSMAVSAVEASARRLAAGADIAREEQRVHAELQTAVPGVRLQEIDIAVADSQVIVSARMRWTPPGPDLVPVAFDVRAARTIAFAP